MNLLAHKLDGTRAIVQHDDGQPYYYVFGDNIDVHQLITDTTRTVDQNTWHTNYSLGNKFDTIGDIKMYLKGYVGGQELVDE